MPVESDNNNDDMATTTISNREDKELVFTTQTLKTMKTTKNNEKECKNNKNEEETEQNSFKWLANNSATTSSLACNKNCIRNIIEDHGAEDIKGHGGVLENKSAEFKGVVQMPHNEQGKTNILSMFDSVKLGFRVRMDANAENKMMVVTSSVLVH